MMNDDENPGLYVHVPFCKTKCPYCGFYSVSALDRIPAYLEAVRKESLAYEGSFSSFDSLYLGGGTPSILPERELAGLIELLTNRFPFLSDTEITVEVNPDDVTPQKMAVLRSAGVNRVSVGVQSFDDGELSRLKRRHSAAQAARALDCIRSAGFDNMGIDLMFGLEGQNERGWLASLERALLFSPEHLSCYQFTYEEGTPFGSAESEGKMRRAGEELERSLFLLTSRRLEAAGYVHYEISNFSKGGERCSRHNGKYWRHTPYLGLGPAAHSFLHGVRWWNVRSLEEYCRMLSSGAKPVEESEALTDEQLRLETLFLGFRTLRGVRLEEFAGLEGSDKALGELIGSGLVSVVEGMVVPSREGFLVADSLPLLFSS